MAPAQSGSAVPGTRVAASVAAEGRTPRGLGRPDTARGSFAAPFARAPAALVAAGLAAARGARLALRVLARRRLGRWGRVRGREDMTSPLSPEPVPSPASGFSMLIEPT